MAIDNRDYYKDRHNAKTAYVERSDFRVSLGELKRRRWRAAWRRNLLFVLLFVLAFIVLRVFR